jgi:hypothetical protein
VIGWDGDASPSLIPGFPAEDARFRETVAKPDAGMWFGRVAVGKDWPPQGAALWGEDPIATGLRGHYS